MPARRIILTSLTVVLMLVAWPMAAREPRLPAPSQGSLQSPEQFLGLRVGADNKLVRWDKIVEYMRLAEAASPRVRVRELGKSTSGNPFIAVEVGAPETLQNIDKYKALERKLYFQSGAPTDSGREQIFREGKAVVLP